MRAEEVHEEDRRRVRDTGEVRRKGESTREKQQVTGQWWRPLLCHKVVPVQS